MKTKASLRSKLHLQTPLTPSVTNLPTLLSEGALWFGEKKEGGFQKKSLSFGIPRAPELAYGAVHEIGSTAPTALGQQGSRKQSDREQGGRERSHGGDDRRENHSSTGGRFAASPSQALALSQSVAPHLPPKHSPAPSLPPLFLPPLFLLGALLRGVPSSHLFVWIGRRIFPTPHLLEETVPNWRERCLFLDPPNREKGIITAMEALRSPAIGAVVLDGERVNLLATRRLQLVARQHQSIALLLRPAEELSLLSAAQTKWRVTPHFSNTELHHHEGVVSSEELSPRWSLEVVKAPGIVASRDWIVQWSGSEKGVREELKRGVWRGAESEEDSPQRAKVV